MNRFIYPKELENIAYREMYEGKIRVYKNGRIFRTNSKGVTVEAPQHAYSRDGRYRSISIMLNGKQKHLYVHRLLAEAFIPNELGKPQVNHIDGDPKNNSIENLEWVTAKENSQHAYNIGLMPTIENDGHPCKLCKKNFVLRADVCNECRVAMKNLKRRLISARAVKDEFADVKLETLPPKEKLIVKMRLRGCTLDEIGERFNFTRERARQILNYVKDGRYNKQPINNPYSNNIKTPFKLTLKAARVNNSISQVFVAKFLNVTKETIHNWESGKNGIPQGKFEKMVNLYGIPMEYLNVEFESGWYRAKSNVN